MPGETPADAALREAHEEIGLDPSTVEIIGELDHLPTITSRSFIVPYVALLAGPPIGLTPNPAEVDAVLHVPVGELLRRRRVPLRGVAVADGRRAARSTSSSSSGDTLWGATAAMMRQLLAWALGFDVGNDHAD